MKKLVLLISMVALLLSCVSVTEDFVQTGNTFPQLEESAFVQVILTNKEIPEFEEIGVAEIKGYSGLFDDIGQSDFVEKAQEIARQSGGDIVILYSVLQKAVTDGDSIEIIDADKKTFIIGKLIK